MLVTEALTEFVIYLDGALTIHESGELVYDHRTIPASVRARITQSVLSAALRSITSFEVRKAWYCLEFPVADEVFHADAPYPPPQRVDKAQIQALSPAKMIVSGNASWERVLRPFDPGMQIRATPDGALGLFELCGYPVAMGNAVDALKKRAKHMTDSNDDDGVAAPLGVIP